MTKDEMAARIAELEAENAQLREQVASYGVEGDQFFDVFLGNPDAYADAPARDEFGFKLPDRDAHTFHDGEVVALLRLPVPTELGGTSGYSEDEVFATITAAGGIWNAISHGKPSWVATEDEGLTGRLTAWYRCDTKPLAEAIALYTSQDSS